MKKIISVFQRNYDGDRLVRDEVTPGAEWVLAGEGEATRKWDGMACQILDGVPYKRHDVRKGKPVPPGAIPAQEPDDVTGHWPHWLPVSDGPEDKRFRDAFNAIEIPRDGTYELLSPTFMGRDSAHKNPEGVPFDVLIPHGSLIISCFPRTFDGMRQMFENNPSIEGVVFWHSDGRMAKIKLRDFGIKRRRCMACGDTRELLGAFGESMVTCPHCTVQSR